MLLLLFFLCLFPSSSPSRLPFPGPPVCGRSIPRRLFPARPRPPPPSCREVSKTRAGLSSPRAPSVPARADVQPCFRVSRFVPSCFCDVFFLFGGVSSPCSLPFPSSPSLPFLFPGPAPPLFSLPLPRLPLFLVLASPGCSCPAPVLPLFFPLRPRRFPRLGQRRGENSCRLLARLARIHPSAFFFLFPSLVSSCYRASSFVILTVTLVMLAGLVSMVSSRAYSSFPPLSFSFPYLLTP